MSAVRRAGDGLPPCRVFVGGREVKKIVLADPERGAVLQHVGFNRRRMKPQYRRLSGRVELRPL